jgi:hypothetical protein
MNYHSVTKYMKFGAVLCAAIFVSACVAPVSKENMIEQRVNERWEKLLSGDLAGAYEYLSPGYRSSVSSLQYQRTILLKQIKWTSAKYLESNCADTNCTAKVAVGFTVYGGVPGIKSFSSTRNVEETWLLVDGIWYFVPKQ